MIFTDNSHLQRLIHNLMLVTYLIMLTYKNKKQCILNRQKKYD
jgi:hypothetical protein